VAINMGGARDRAAFRYLMLYSVRDAYTDASVSILGLQVSHSGWDKPGQKKHGRLQTYAFSRLTGLSVLSHRQLC